MQVKNVTISIVWMCVTYCHAKVVANNPIYTIPKVMNCASQCVQYFKKIWQETTEDGMAYMVCTVIKSFVIGPFSAFSIILIFSMSYS